ncbi:EF-hand domain-containing protein [Oleomonas cavernae]|uniref:EF-hand domain-containing protein n=1 Tax=Oleomonas cavernae TaxID=2320859 RepID=A0A418WEX0_9PROT|nr:EF-hand domain-containing protein [Oleomonas cavernae]RJF88565.1 EF-hand domain-containing protein [Oleomonas cavernae]
MPTLRRLDTRPGSLLLATCLISALGACGDGRPAGMVALAALPTAPATTLAGDLLNAGHEGDCPTLMAQWSSSADGNGDGLLELDEAQADAARLFALLDRNGDRFLSPSELAAYRDRVAPAAYADRAVSLASHNTADSDSQKKKTLPATHDVGLRGEPDPIMAADGNLDFRVSPDELAAKVAERFARLDRDHDGKLDAGELAAYCPGR